MNVRCQVGLLLMLVVSSCFIGCKPAPEDWTPADREKIIDVVANVSERKTDLVRLAELFTADAAPDKAWVAGLKGISLEIEDDTIRINKDEADVKIQLVDFYGVSKGDVVWKCVRAGETWKISESPLE